MLHMVLFILSSAAVERVLLKEKHFHPVLHTAGLRYFQAAGMGFRGERRALRI